MLYKLSISLEPPRDAQNDKLLTLNTATVTTGRLNTNRQGRPFGPDPNGAPERERGQRAVRSDVRQLRLDLVPGVPEDLDGRLGHLVVLHLEALQQGLVRLGRVEGGGVGERQHLGRRSAGR